MNSAPTSFTYSIDYLISKYGSFEPATLVVPVDVAASQTIPDLDGKEFLTLADLKTVKSAIDNQITRLETIRSSSATYQKKQNDLEELSARLANLITENGQGQRIRTTTAREFLEKFRYLDTIPPLFELIAAPAPSKEEPTLYSIVQKLKMDMEQQQMMGSDIGETYILRLNALEKRIVENSMLGNPIPNDIRNEFMEILKKVYTTLI